MNPKNMLTTLAIIVVVFLAGCKKDDFVEIDVTCPIVVSTSPANLENGVLPVSRNITATFNTPMNPASFVPESFKLQQGISTSAIFVEGALSYNEYNNTMNFNPTNNLLENTTYTATISRMVKESRGNFLRQDYVWVFTIGATKGPAGVQPMGIERFGILAGDGISNNAGPSTINNLDLGIYPGFRSSITGFFDVDGGPGIINNGDFYAADDGPSIETMLLQAQTDLTDLYLFIEAATLPASVTVSGDQGGKTLTPGIYKSTSTLLIQSGNLTLDALGEPDAVWIFQIASDFTTVGGGTFPSSTGGNVILAGGAQAKNVYWQVGSSAVIGDYTSFKGNILALTSITMNAFAQANGRMLCQNGAVTLTSTNIINQP
jgi:hypothetical protein